MSGWSLTTVSRDTRGTIDVLLTVYDVDDLLLMGLRSSCVGVAAQLSSTFDLAPLGPVKYLLDIEVNVNRV